MRDEASLEIAQELRQRRDLENYKFALDQHAIVSAADAAGRTV